MKAAGNIVYEREERRKNNTSGSLLTEDVTTRLNERGQRENMSKQTLEETSWSIDYLLVSIVRDDRSSYVFSLNG